MDTSNSFTNNDMINVLKDILHKIIQNDLSHEQFIYIGSYNETFDLTIFEDRSNKCEIGITAGSRKSACCLLFILRVIIDSNLSLALSWPLDNTGINNFSIEDLITIYGEYEEDDLIPFSHDSIICRDYYIKKPDEIDIWSAERMLEFFQSLEFEEEDADGVT